MPAGLDLATTIEAWARLPRPDGLDRPAGGSRGPRVRRRRGGVLLAAGPPRRRRHRGAGRARRPGRVRRHVAARRAGSGSADDRPPSDDAPADEDALPIPLRLSLVRRPMDGTRPGRPRGLGPAVPDLPRQGRHEPVPAGSPPRRADLAGGGGRSAGGSRRRDACPSDGGRRIDRRPTTGEATCPHRPPILRSPTTGSCATVPTSMAPVHDTAWTAELDAVTRWLDGRPLAGRILEPGAGVGFFSPLLAEHGELHATDPDGAALDRARDRLLAHRLPAHLHVADPWTCRPGRAAGRRAGRCVPARSGARAGLDGAAASFRARLRRGAALAVIELRPDCRGRAAARHGLDVARPVRSSRRRWPGPGSAPSRCAETGRFFLLASATAV